MKKILVLLIACFACIILPAQQLHWTPVSEGLYSGSTTVIAVVQINGVEQASTQMELAAFSGEECRGTAFTTEFPITHRFLAMVNVYGEIGHELTFKAYDHATNQDLLDMNPVVTVVFSEDGSGSLFEPLVLNFTTNYDITVSANPTAGGTVSGAGNYNHGASCTLTATPATGYTFTKWTKDGTQVSTNASFTFTVTNSGSYVAVFTKNTYSISASASPSTGGSVTGGGMYEYGASCTLTATPALGYNFVNWTENGSVVSANAVYTFSVVEQRNLIANFNQEVVIENITFADADVKALCVANWDTNGDGELSYTEAAAVTDLGTVFKQNNNIISFDELQYFSRLTSIATKAFYACSKLTTITIPNSVVSIGEKAFNNCSSLAQITVAEGNTVYDSRNNCNAVIKTSTNRLVVGCKTTIIPNSVTCIGYYSFAGSYYLLSIEIPNSVTIIESGAFYGCSRLTTIEIPNSVTIIKNGAFASSGLTTVIIGNSVETIETMAFYDCSSIASLYVLSETPPILETGTYGHAFVSVDKSIPIYVPCGTVDTYQAASGWSEFTNYQELECPSYVITATANPAIGGTIAGAGTYTQDETCTLTATANAGYAFVNWTESGTVVSTEASYTFTVTEERTLVANFEITGPITLHWTPIQNFENTMDGIGVVVIDGVEQQSAGLELGIFCDDECRGAVLPEEESGRWFYYFTMGGIQGESFGFRLYDHTANQELDLFCSEIIPFEINSFIGDFEDPHAFLFSNNVTISAQVNPDGAGVVTGTGDWPWGSSVTLTATANEGFAFLNWSIGDEIVSTEPSLAITAEASMDIVANFNYVQSWSLQSGWTWWGTYVELSNLAGLSMLEEALGDAGVMIKTKNAYARVNASHTWYGSLKSINNETGYKIQTSSACDIAMTGALATPANHPITIGNGWNWIGYPVMIAQSPNAALTGFQPENKDVIKGQSGYARYDSNSGTWKPTSFTLVPGRSYLYYSNATESKSMVFASSRDEQSIETENCHWTGDIHAFPDNNSILAIVKNDGVEQRDGALELGAFVDGQCRGSVKLFYDDDYDRYFAMLTVTAQDGEEIHFGIFDPQSGEANMNCVTRMTFESDAIIGDFTSPLEIDFATRRNESANMSVYPNPMDRNQKFSIQLPEGELAAEVTVTDATGVMVRCKTGRVDVTMIDGFQTAGVYVVRVTCASGNVYHHKLVVK